MSKIKFFAEIIGFIMFVPSISDTVSWYEKHLGILAEAADDEHGMFEIILTASDATQSCYRIHLLGSDDENNRVTGANAGIFLFVEGLNTVREQILGTGWDKVSEIRKENWGATLFSVYDLNGFELRICEW